jgi:hypothetical protein
MADADETKRTVVPAFVAWFEPSESKRFAKIGDVIYALTTLVAILLGLGVGIFWGQMVNILGMIAAFPIWLAGRALQYKLGGRLRYWD